MSQILGVNDPYVIPGTMGGGGSSLPEDSAGYLYNDGSGNLSYDTAPTPEPAGSTTQIQYNKAGVMSASANLTYDESNLTLVDGALRSNVTWDDYTYGSAIKYGTVSQLILSNPTEGFGSVSFYGQWFQVFNGATNEKRSQTVVANYANISLSDGSVDETDYAYGWFRVSGTANVLEGETVTIGSTVYTFRATLASEGDVKISTTLLLSLTNLMYAINGTGTVGVNHQVTAAHADVECTGVYASTVNLKARVAGSAAEAIGLSETSGRLTRSAATMLRESANKYSKVYGFEHAIAVTKGSAQAVKGYTSIVNVGDSTADRTVGSAWGIEQHIAIAALDKTISRGTLKGAYIGCYHNGGLATSQYGVDVDMTVTDDGTGNIAAVTGDVAGLRITMTPDGTPVIGGAVYGIYVSDVSGFTTPSGGAYGLYVAGATANNYIAGNLEVAGTLTANLGSPLTLSRTVDDADGFQINVVQSRGAAGQDNDVLGTISFQGYNDKNDGGGPPVYSPELIEFAKITATIADASDGTEDGAFALSLIGAGTAYDAFKVSSAPGYSNVSFDGTGGGVNFTINAAGPFNSSGTLNINSIGGNASLYWTSTLAARYRIFYGGNWNSLNLYDDTGGGGYIWTVYDGNFVITPNGEHPTLGTSAKNILGMGQGTAPTTVATDFIQIWCADYAAGDARLYLMAEASTNKTIFGSGKIVFSDPNVNHGMTTYMATDEYFKIEETSAGLGGASIFAATDDYGVTPLTFKALLGNAASNDSCISFVFGVKSGSGITAYGAMGTPWCVAFYNNTTLLGGWVNDGFSVNGAAYIRIKDMDVGIKCTTLTGGAPYTCGQLSELHATNGGMQVLGLSGNKDQEALVVHGNLSSSTTPSDTTPALVLKGSKYSGSGFDPGALSASQTVMQILNYTTVLATLKGGNYWQLTNSTTAPGSIATDAVQLWCADYAAGDARLYIMGEKNTNKLIFGAGNVMLRPDTMADDSVSGETFTGTAGENLVWGDVVYLKSDGKFWKADFNATTTTPAVAFCTGTINADASGEFLRRGWIRDDSAYDFTFGAQAGTIYLGESGAITQTAPSGSGDQVQVLGWALEADIWYFDPQFVIVEV